MLDTDTKRRIDTARDILVGKVPDPKSQVEQITIALIYKFMDDMDAESEEFGGKRKFFAGEFARYGWAKLMRSGLGGHETLNVYAEAIARMPENPGIPLLFRDIFKNAYLPYRDPETLRAFLKIIDEFTYDHSERLGDAFEYLLSVLGSQGDAGQFRTPRHIIDFMVAVVDPKKTDRVLDPACGTAGFLISAYKHILVANRTDMDEQDGQDENKESRESCPSMFVSSLTPDEKGRLAQNFNGYDISPDMVRLSLVNLYLHGFSDPHIAEYDTLTSQDKWNETADVILANPPFMSPKGGIKPHNRFGVQSKRSEVLFVDYMAEHLTPTGRAGIIVPEGIIFQSQTAYKDLRKMLVENSLVAVVSLPAGVFNPYSGVKTSILILDKSLARQSNTIGFFKVENDGFGLGAQRREIDKNDLPQVRSEIAEYLRRLRAGETVEPSPSGRGQGEGFQPTLGLIVEKAKVAANGDYNLSGERYRENGTRIHTYPLARIADVCKINPPKSELSELSQDTRVSFVPMADMSELRMLFQPVEERSLAEVTTSYTYFRDSDVLFARVTPCFENGKGGIARGLTNGIGFGSSEFYILRASEQVLPEWLYFCVMHPLFREAGVAQMTGTGGLQRVPRDFVENFQIPLPPLPVQQEIVAEIEGYQKVIDGARAVLDNYRPHIPIHPDWPMVELEDTCYIQRGKFTHRPRNEPRFYGGKYPFIQTGDIVRANGGKITYTQTLNDDGLSISKLFQPPVVVITIAANIGDTAVLDFPSCFPDSVVGLTPKPGTDAHFLELAMRTKKQHLNDIAPQAAQKNINIEILKTVKVPLPPLATQQAIVAEIEAEQALVAANRDLIERFEKKIQAALARVWGE
ncbi:MAG: N-6 DNA methylase [Armatimonadetes bacterium CG_4_8_14_3_um_filter_58_9]|nr:MAG: N-6 DNA methylase [Armatimonadetes bacterium CG_4_8_14_3_um_filter_58_9]